MKIVLIKDHQEKILEKEFWNSSRDLEKSIGIVSVEKKKNTNEFTLRIFGVNHIRYRYSPKTQKFEVHFLSLKKQNREKGKNGHGTMEPIGNL